MTSGGSKAPLVMLATLVFCYFLSQFFRGSVGVLGPDLMRDIGLSPQALGDLGGSFFLAFALAQVPIGILLDRFGPRCVVSIVVCAALVGALVFASAEDVGTLVFGRVLIGLGCAPLYMGSLVVLSRWVSPDRFSASAGQILAFGGLGGLLATTPLALANAYLGWRIAFVAMALVTALTAAAIWTFVRDAPAGHPFFRRQPETLRMALAGVVDVLRIRRLFLIFPINSVGYASLLTVLTLWGAPYMKDVHGLDDVARGNVLLIMTLAWMAGSMVIGRLERILNTRKWLILACVGTTAGLCIVQAALPPSPFLLVAVVMGAMGFSGASGVVIIAHAKSLLPERLVGRGLTLNNLFGFGGAAVLQMVSGRIIGAFPVSADGAAPGEAYTAMFFFLAAVLTVAGLIYLRIPDAP
ncbi:MAG: MFS transporter, partial [Rhodospirillaceae bacterium]|nr:MFS transporter [Rhodospirillaceae bacterium]